MLISKLFPPDDMEGLDGINTEECLDHQELRERLRKTLYFGKTPKMDRASMPMTELAVEFLQGATPKQLGKVKMDWASSVSRQAGVSPCSMMLGMLYVDRLRHKNPDYLQTMSSEDLFLISMMVASKYLYDEGITEEVYNDEWADSADLSVEDINEMERDFLSAIDWNLYVQAEEFWKSLLLLEQRVCRNEGQRRGFFTYSDLHVLSDSERFTHLVQQMLLQVCQVACVLSVAYAAGLATLAVSPIALSMTKSCMNHAAVCVMAPAPTMPNRDDGLRWSDTATTDPEGQMNRSRIEQGNPDTIGNVAGLGSDSASPYELTSPEDLETTPSRLQPDPEERSNHVGQCKLSPEQASEHKSSLPTWLQLSGLLAVVAMKEKVTYYILGSTADDADVFDPADHVCCSACCKNATGCTKSFGTTSGLPATPMVALATEVSLSTLTISRSRSAITAPFGPRDRILDH